MRSMAARALGIRGDKASADALAELAQNDPEYMVRIRAVESLGLLKMKLGVIETVKRDRENGVSWAADLAEGRTFRNASTKRVAGKALPATARVGIPGGALLQVRHV